MLLEFFYIVFYKSLTWVSYVESFSFLNFVEYNKVVLIPVEDAGRGYVFYLLNIYLTAFTIKPQRICCVPDA